jgi:hypothetical protein
MMFMKIQQLNFSLLFAELVILLIIFLFISIGSAIIYSLVIIGTKKVFLCNFTLQATFKELLIFQRNHNLIRPGLFVIALTGSSLVLFNVLKCTLEGDLFAMLNGLIFGYIHTCLFSLYVKIRDEKANKTEAIQI